MVHPIRLLIDDFADGVANMARDEALLEKVGQGQSPPTLRFYQWNPPTISLGYFQKYEEFERLPPPAGELAVVRRTTGGGAILHDREWTYSLTLPIDHLIVKGKSPTFLYERVHDALIATLGLVNVQAQRSGCSDGSSAAKGPFFCFERRHCLDVVIREDKLAGSAQRRAKTAILQHGSIILANRFEQHRVATLQDHIYLQGQSLLEPLIEALQQQLSCKLDSGRWSKDELMTAKLLEKKYCSEEWTQKY